MQELITRIYCDVDEFCKTYQTYSETHLLSEGKGQRVYPRCNMSLSEVMSIVILFHISGYRCFKWFYSQYVCKHLQSYYPKRLSYNRFVEVMQSCLTPLLLYTLKFKIGKCTGLSFVDSTPLKVCHSRRIYSHKVFDGLAQRGKSSTGWFYGFKLHLAINEKGELLSFCLTPGNIDDRNMDVIDKLCYELTGKLFADRGYISAKLFEHLFSKGLQLVTKIKKNMKNKLMDISDKVLLRKRAVIESVNDFLKNICQIEHTRHRSVLNFLVNLISGLAAYQFLPKKPSLHFEHELQSLIQ